MRKITDKGKIESKKKKIVIVSLLLLALLVLSTLGYALISNPGGGQDEKKTENVQNIGGLWIADFGEERLYFSNSPEEVRNISVEVDFYSLEDFFSRPLYVVSNKEGITQEIAQNIGRYTDRMQPACYGKCDEDLPEKNCSDNLIVWKEADENKVYQNESCVFIEGDMKAVDAFLYRLFGFL
jgi:hypothetical protein